MKGYFVRKPITVDDVKDGIRYARESKMKPVKIEVLEHIILTIDEYLYFCTNLYRNFDFLKNYTEKSTFTDNAAKCVLVGAPGQPYIAVCLEGYAYPRYAAMPFSNRYQLAALLSE